MEAAIKSGPQVISFIDIGTNAVRLLVVRINPNFSYTIISQEKEVVRLGEKEFGKNELQEPAMDRTIFVCKKFVELSKVYGAVEIVAVGTSAIREARNRLYFLQKLLQETGLTIHVISGRDEARLIWAGVSEEINIGEEKAIFIDLGGGSTEVAIGNQNECFYASSLKLGAIRLTSKFIGEGWTGHVSYGIYKKIKQYASMKMQDIKAKVLEYGVKIAWGSSGTIINLAEVSAKMIKKKRKSNESILSRKNLKKTASILCALSLEERRKVPALNPERADIIIAGAAIIEAIMEEFGLEEIIISHRELRDGLLAEYLSSFEGYRALRKTPMRNRSVLRLGRSCSFDEKHSETVSSLALQLFDSAKEIGLHDLGEGEKELLKFASTLHDIGDFLSFNDHQLHSHYIINNSNLAGFGSEEILVMANIARFHRKKLPSRKAMKDVKVSAKIKETICILSTFLRFAEKLDRSHCGLVKKAKFAKNGKDRILLLFYSDSDCSFEEWSIIQNRQAFLEAFNMQLVVRCVVTPGM
jgi:exopolyphosphatase/guanosine-5'-triphosphate,3'-diphosphate pyrophosphatase